MSRYVTNPVQDSEEQAAQNYKVCQIDKPRAAALAEETVAIWTSVRTPLHLVKSLTSELPLQNVPHQPCLSRRCAS